MDCETAKHQLGLYLDKALAPEDRTALEAHLGDCAACARELAGMTEMVSALVPRSQVQVPERLWSAIEAGLDQADGETARPFPIRLLRLRPAMAASILFVVGAGLLTLSWVGGGNEAAAATLDYGVLLDALPLDANRAFQSFLTRYGAQRITPTEAKRRASGLNFDLPETLPGGFELQEVSALRFGKHLGIAARYSRNGELLGAIFHPPVGGERFGTHREYACVIGKHRGHQVTVGEWKLVHVTDPTTCHCILSKLDQVTELPAVMQCLIPETFPEGAGGHDHQHDHNHATGG